MSDLTAALQGQKGSEQCLLNDILRPLGRPESPGVCQQLRAVAPDDRGERRLAPAVRQMHQPLV
jgi:hypothetical protein